MEQLSRMVPLGDVFKVSSGGTPNRKKDEYFNNGHIPWVKTGELKGKFANTPSEFITQLGIENSSAKLFPPKTVLLAMYGATIGACSILDFEAATNQACAAILPSDDCDESYLYYYLSSIKRTLVNKGVGGAQPNISAALIKKIRIPLPPLEEQKKIASILDAADRLRKKDQQLIAKYNALSQSLFLDMFGDYINTDLIPLRQLVKFSQGQQFPLEEQLLEPKNGYSRFLRIIDFTQGDNLRYVPNCHEKNYVKKGDIVMVRYGASAGFVGMNKEGILANNLFKVNFDRNQFHQLFLFYIFNHERFKAFLEKEAFGAAMPALSFKVMERFKIPVPPIALQVQFAKHIQAIEIQKQQAQTSLQKSKELFNSLLQRAFNGELTAAEL